MKILSIPDGPLFSRGSLSFMTKLLYYGLKQAQYCAKHLARSNSMHSRRRDGWNSAWKNCFRNSFFKCGQRFSRGLRSRDCAGHFITDMWASTSNSAISADLWQGALSCMKRRLLSVAILIVVESPGTLRISSTKERSQSNKISKYASLSTLPPSQTINGSNFSPVKPAYIIILTRPDWNVGIQFSFLKPSPFFLMHHSRWLAWTEKLATRWY